MVCKGLASLDSFPIPSDHTGSLCQGSLHNSICDQHKDLDCNTRRRVQLLPHAGASATGTSSAWHWMPGPSVGWSPRLLNRKLNPLPTSNRKRWRLLNPRPLTHDSGPFLPIARVLRSSGSLQRPGKAHVSPPARMLRRRRPDSSDASGAALGITGLA